MRRIKIEYIPSTSDIKILKTVSLLNERDLYPLALGVYKIITGSDEPEYQKYKELETYSTLISLNSKHVSRLIMMLLRKGYLENIYDENTNELYLKISDKGSKFLFDYSKKHKYSFKRKVGAEKPLIVEIKDKKR